MEFAKRSLEFNLKDKTFCEIFPDVAKVCIWSFTYFLFYHFTYSSNHDDKHFLQSFPSDPCFKEKSLFSKSCKCLTCFMGLVHVFDYIVKVYNEWFEDNLVYSLCCLFSRKSRRNSISVLLVQKLAPVNRNQNLNQRRSHLWLSCLESNLAGKSLLFQILTCVIYL